jgi:hypothetical protein
MAEYVEQAGLSYERPAIVPWVVKAELSVVNLGLQTKPLLEGLKIHWPFIVRRNCEHFFGAVGFECLPECTTAVIIRRAVHNTANIHTPPLFRRASVLITNVLRLKEISDDEIVNLQASIFFIQILPLQIMANRSKDASNVLELIQEHNDPEVDTKGINNVLEAPVNHLQSCLRQAFFHTHS